MSDTITLEDKFQCRLCRKKFSEPRVLPCLHTFCTECLRSVEPYLCKQESPINGNLESDETSVKYKTSEAKRNTLLPFGTNSSSGSASGYESEAKETSESQSLTSGFNFTGSSSGSENSPNGSWSSVQVTPKSRRRRSRRQHESSGKEILCPACDTEVELPLGGVEEFPLNYIVQNQMVLESLNRDTTRLFCDLCSADIQALSRCSECMINLCAFCSEAHKRQRRTAGHDVMTLLEARRKGITKILRQVMCSQHPDQELRFFCETCAQTFCRDCCVVDHREHACEFISDVEDSYTQILHNAIDNMRPTVEHIRTSLETVKEVTKKVSSRATQVEEEVDLYIDSYIKALVEHRQNLQSEIKKMKEKKLKLLKIQTIHLERQLEDMSSAVSFAKELLSEGSNVEILSFVAQIMKRFEQVKKMKQRTEPTTDDYMIFLSTKKAGHINGYPVFGSITSQCVSPTHCVVRGEGLNNCLQNQKTELLLMSRDTDGQPVNRGGEDVTVELIWTEGKQKNVPVQISDRMDGTYVLSFTPDMAGAYQFTVQLQGKHIQGSPITLTVKPPLKKHTGTFHCCTFCSSNGSREATCGCGGKMPGGYKGCGHGHSGHPGRKHWSCCGKILEYSECGKQNTAFYQFTL